MAVPNDYNFDLIRVIQEVGGPQNSLKDCVDDAQPSAYDSMYSGSKNSLKNFRNYNEVAAFLTVSPSSHSFTHAANSVTININSSNACSLSDNSSWISLSSSSAPSGNSSRTISVSYNSGSSSRSGTVTVNNGSQIRQVNIYQAIFCLVYGTKITLYDGSLINIQDIKEGMILLSPVINGFTDSNTDDILTWKSKDIETKMFQSEVINIVAVENQPVISINDGLIEATEKHIQFYGREGVWRFGFFDSIMKGDILMDKKGDNIRVNSVSKPSELKIVFRLTLGGPSHTFYANNLITHNVKPPQ